LKSKEIILPLNIYYMPILHPKQFIKQVFIEEVKPLVNQSPYIAFAIMAIGIEFLGKCLDSKAVEWNVRHKGESNFKLAINSLNSLNIYIPKAVFLYDALRCGFAHSFVPKAGLTLSSKNEMSHMFHHNDSINLRCEDFYNDFRKACQEVINMEFIDPNDKMNKGLLGIPNNTLNTSPFIIVSDLPNSATGTTDPGSK
jgi:hypothetical protein